LYSLDILMKKPIRLIFMFFILYCRSLFGQIDNENKFSIHAGFNLYSETEKVFSFKKQDNSNFRFRNGFNFVIGLRKELNDKMSLKGTIGYGWFKRTTITLNDSTINYKTNYIPLMLNGSVRLLAKGKTQIYFNGGIGVHYLLITETYDQNRTDEYTKLDFTPSYGFDFKYKNLIYSMQITRILKRNFFTGTLTIPLKKF